METPTHRSRVVKLSLLLVLLTTAAMGRIVFNDFVNWDDQETIRDNPHLHPVTISSLKFFWSKPQGQLFIPLTYTVWAVVASISHSASAFHAASLLLHVATALVVFATLRLLVRDDLAAFFGAAIFAVHPVQMEAVAWASGLKDVLSGLLGIAGVLCVARVFNPCARLKHGLQTRATGNVLASNILFVLAMLAKPAAVVMPLVAGWIAYWVLDMRFRECVKWLVVPILCGIAVTLITSSVQPASEAPRVQFSARPLVAADAINFYFTKLVAPIHLGIDYGRSPDVVMHQQMIYFIWLIPTAIGFACIVLRKRAPWLIAGCGAFVIALLPVLGFVPFDFQKNSTVTDHYLYPAMLAVAWIVGMIAKHQGARVVVSIAVVICAILSFVQLGYWRDSQALFNHALQANPRSYVSHNVLGFLAAQSNDPGAEDHYRAVLKLRPGDNVARANLANLLTRRAISLEKTNRLPEAEDAMREALAVDPQNPDRQRNLDVFLQHREKAAP